MISSFFKLAFFFCNNFFAIFGQPKVSSTFRVFVISILGHLINGTIRHAHACDYDLRVVFTSLAPPDTSASSYVTSYSTARVDPESIKAGEVEIYGC